MKYELAMVSETEDPISDELKAKIAAYREKDPRNQFLNDQECLKWMAKEEREEKEKLSTPVLKSAKKTKKKRSVKTTNFKATRGTLPGIKSSSGLSERRKQKLRDEVIDKTGYPPEFFNFNQTESGWQLLYDAGLTEKLPPKLINFLGFADRVRGQSMRNMVRFLDAETGQLYAEYLFKNQRLLPKGWQGYYLLFTGTVWKRPDNKSSYIPYLIWNGKKWLFSFHILDYFFDGRYRAVTVDDGRYDD